MNKLFSFALILLFSASCILMLVSQRHQIVNQSNTIEVLLKHLDQTSKKNNNLVHTNSILRKRILELESLANGNDSDALSITNKEVKEKSFSRNVSSKK